MSIDLLIHEAIHFFLSLLIGLLLYRVYGKKYLIILALAFGLLIDFDHLIDYFISNQFSHFSLAEFLEKNFFEQKVYVFFHGWEYSLILLALAYYSQKYRAVLVAIALALLGHLIFDQMNIAVIISGHQIAGYSFVYRAIHDFTAAAFNQIIF